MHRGREAGHAVLSLNREGNSAGFGVRQCPGAFRRPPTTESGAEPPHSKTLREERGASLFAVHGPNTCTKVGGLVSSLVTGL
jgi:hypothetical protein